MSLRRETRLRIRRNRLANWLRRLFRRPTVEYIQFERTDDY